MTLRLDQLKTDLSTQAIPVIVATPKGKEEDQLRARNIGAWAYVTVNSAKAILEWYANGDFYTLSNLSHKCRFLRING